MSKFCLTCIIFSLVTLIILSPVQSHNSPWANGGNMDGSLDAQVHGDINRQFNFDPVTIHLHSMAYADIDHHPIGFHTFAYNIEMTKEGKVWWDGDKIEGNRSDPRSFFGGCNRELKFDEEYSTDHVPGGAQWRDNWVTWAVGSTVTNTVTGKTDTDFMEDGKRAPAPNNNNNGEDDEDDEDDEGGEGGNPPGGCLFGFGLFPGNGSYNITINGEEMVDTAPGDTVTVDLVMPSDKGYSQIYWYLAGPNDLGLGNGIGVPTSPSGSGIETEVTHSFSMPSDASGVYTFTAYIYPHSSASDQAIYEYTIKIYCS